MNTIYPIVLSLFCGQAAATIIQTGPCSCLSDRGWIDLSSLASNDETPAYTGIEVDSVHRTLSWNPCIPFSKDGCSDAAVCEDGDTVLGTQDSAMFVESGTDTLLTYTSENRKVSINLVCADKDEGLKFDRVDSDLHYHLTLAHHHACWTSGLNPPPPNITFPTPSAVTVTSGPSDLQTVEFLLSIEVLATVLILIVVVSAMLAYLNCKLRLRQSRSTPMYQQLVLDDDAMIKI